jgi:hypothetical protein
MYTQRTVLVARERGKDLMREAEQERLLRGTRESNAGLYRRVLANVGKLMITAGRTPQDRNELAREGKPMR